MFGDPGTLATAITVFLSPFLPYLVEFGKEGAKKLGEVLAEQGGKTALEKAKTIWEQLHGHNPKDKKLLGAATMVAADSKDPEPLAILTRIISEKLQKDPDLANRLLQELGGGDAVQQILADHKSRVESSTQELTWAGSQTIKASQESTIKGVHQVIKKSRKS